MEERDAVVVGAGPNGLAAAIALARAGLFGRALRGGRDGGGRRALGRADAPRLPPRHLLGDLSAHGGDAVPAQPAPRTARAALDPPPSSAGPSASTTARRPSSPAGSRRPERASASRADARAWERLFRPFSDGWMELSPDLLGPARLAPPSVPHGPLRAGGAARRGRDWRRAGSAASAPAPCFAGLAGHSFLPLDQIPTASFGLMLGGHRPRRGLAAAGGGSPADLRTPWRRCSARKGGTIRTGHLVKSLDELPRARAYLFDLTPAQLLQIEGIALAGRLPPAARAATATARGSSRSTGRSPEPIPWKAEALPAGRDGPPRRARWRRSRPRRGPPGTGASPTRPFTLVGQATLFDPTRAPAGRHTAWAYCHVPHGSTADFTAADRGADRALRPRLPGRRAGPAHDEHRPARGPRSQPRRRRHQRRRRDSGAALHPARGAPRPLRDAGPAGLHLLVEHAALGGGVHGMCGYHAAKAALKSINKGVHP